MSEDIWLKKFYQKAVPIISAEFQPQKLIVFGSRVMGQAKEESDIDVIVISENFQQFPFLKRMPQVLKKVNFPKHIDYICYTPKEFENIKNKSSLVMDALENGIEIEMGSKINKPRA